MQKMDTLDLTQAKRLCADIFWKALQDYAEGKDQESTEEFLGTKWGQYCAAQAGYCADKVLAHIKDTPKELLLAVVEQKKMEAL